MAMMNTSQRLTFTSAAANKLSELKRSWDVAHPDKVVMPAIYVRKKNALAILGVGFLLKEALVGEVIIKCGQLDIVFDVADEDRRFVDGKTVDFNGEMFVLQSKAG